VPGFVADLPAPLEVVRGGEQFVRLQPYVAREVVCMLDERGDDDAQPLVAGTTDRAEDFLGDLLAGRRGWGALAVVQMNPSPTGVASGHRLGEAAVNLNDLAHYVRRKV
jgi:hypothetical protein